MQIQIADAMKRAGETFSFERSETPEAFSFGERTLEFCGPVAVRGTYAFDGKAFAVSAEASAELLSVCARCAKPFCERVEFSFSERFVKDQPDSGDDETYPCAGEELDLTKAVLDNLLLEMPIASVCREDCKGLCPVCGADRNEAECPCVKTEARED